MRAEGVVVVRAEAGDNARYRLRKRALEERVAVVGEKTAHLHYDGRQIDMRRLAANRVPCVAHGLKLMPGDVERRLQTDALPDVELALPFLAHLAHDARDLMAKHRRPRRDVLRHALVARPQRRALVVAEADRVRHDLHDDSLFARRLEFNVFQPRVLRAVQSPCFRFHFAAASLSLACILSLIIPVGTVMSKSIHPRLSPRLLRGGLELADGGKHHAWIVGGESVKAKVEQLEVHLLRLAALKRN